MLSLRRRVHRSAAAFSLPLVVAAGWRILLRLIAAADWQALDRQIEVRAFEMNYKPPEFERALTTQRDPRRRYGARVDFSVQRPEYLGFLNEATPLLPTGHIGLLAPIWKPSIEGGTRYRLELAGYRAGAIAEAAGRHASQALLVTAIALRFGLQLRYSNQEHATVIDRMTGSGPSMQAEGFSSFGQETFLDTLFFAFNEGTCTPNLLLSMELFASTELQVNELTKLVTAVSALEPLADQQELGQDVESFVREATQLLANSSGISIEIAQSLRGRVQQLRKESIRQALFRLSDEWFPGNKSVRADIDRLYALRSEILHNGRVSDPDVVLASETQRASDILRHIYSRQFQLKFQGLSAL